MAVLQNGTLPPCHVPDSSTLKVSGHKPTIFNPKFKVRASTATIAGLRHRRVSNQKYAHTHLVTSTRNANNSNNPSVNGKIELFECLSILSQFNKNSKHMSDCRQIHAKFIKIGAFELSGLIGSKLAILYSRNKEWLDNARQLFDEIPERIVSVYATLMGTYCRAERWEDLFVVFRLMVDEAMLPDKYLVPTILKACSATQILRSGKMVHGYVLRNGFESDVFSGNALIDLYANCGDLRSSKIVFNTMKDRDVVSWTTLISAYMDGGLLDEAEEFFRSMLLNGVKPDLICWNTLISGYARNGEIDLALQSLEEMQVKGLKPEVVSWNGIISGCVQVGCFEDALEVFCKMLWFPEDPNAVTIVSILPACAGLRDLNLGRAVHGCALKHEFCGNTYIEGSLIDMYSKCGRSDCAERIFVAVGNKNTAMWNEMIAAYVNAGKMEAAMSSLHLMQSDGFEPDVITYNTILSGHARSGQKTEAYKLLSEMVQMNLKPNNVSFNILLSGFQQSGLTYESLKLFQTMQLLACGDFSTDLLCSSNFSPVVPNLSIHPSPIAATVALAACADLNLLHPGKEIHGYAVKNGFEPSIFVSSALVDMYMQCHDVDSATKVFWRTEDRNTVAWNAYMAGLINNTQHEVALRLLYEMLEEGIEPSSITFKILLAACGDVAALRVGRELHGYIVKIQSDEFGNGLASGLIDMYARSGNIMDAKLVFDSEIERDVALCNAMISAYSVNDMVADAMTLFEKMELLGIAPDHITFMAILSICIRDGLLEEGWKYFNLMKSYGFTAGLEHYTCMVGILGGAGLLEEAFEFIKQMPYKPNAFVWATLLRACRIHPNPEIRERAVKALFELDPNNSSKYIPLSNVCGLSVMWDSLKNVRSLMTGGPLLAVKECSFINVGPQICAFRESKGLHSVLGKVFETWNELACKMKRAGYYPLDPVFENEEKPNQVSCLHTEKLALSYAIISSNACGKIYISKNRRMCDDCHSTTKLLSKIEEREIHVKDLCFYHHFKDGVCCCQDRW